MPKSMPNTIIDKLLRLKPAERQINKNLNKIIQQFDELFKTKKDIEIDKEIRNDLLNFKLHLENKYSRIKENPTKNKNSLETSQKQIEEFRDFFKFNGNNKSKFLELEKSDFYEK